MTKIMVGPNLQLGTQVPDTKHRGYQSFYSRGLWLYVYFCVLSYIMLHTATYSVYFIILSEKIYNILDDTGFF